ncbi:MAG: ubiquinol-cytochrome c reductase iron-sulfur subunit, partial [Proteobacteria bacterium]|nr:ubiquinol-cytochrome c reductase iron-sulfur subunit [Pseudomonadota bacterium]
MSDESTDQTRRQLLAITTGLGLAGTAVASIPFVLSMQPSARARALGAPVEVDISKLEAGQRLVVEWRGKPV